MATNKSKIEAFFREFPFLAKYISMDKVTEVHVQRIDQELFRRKREEDYKACEDTLLSDGYTKEELILLNRVGYELARVGEWVQEHKHRWLFCDCPPRSSTVEEALRAALRRYRTEDVAFVLSILRGCVVLYKPPKGFTVRDWIQELIRRESAMLKSELAKIDAEATATPTTKK